MPDEPGPRYPFPFDEVHRRPQTVPFRCRSPIGFLRSHDTGIELVIIQEVGETDEVEGVPFRQCRSCAMWQYWNAHTDRWHDLTFEPPVPAMIRNHHAPVVEVVGARETLPSSRRRRFARARKA